MRSLRLLLAALAFAIGLPAQAASIVYDSFLHDVAVGTITSGTTYKCMLLTSSYTPARTHSRRSDLTNEASGTGYTAAGATANPTSWFTTDTTNHRTQVVYPSVSWTTSTITARYLACYAALGGASSADPLVYLNDFGSDVSSTAGTFTVNSSTINFNTP